MAALVEMTSLGSSLRGSKKASKKKSLSEADDDAEMGKTALLKSDGSKKACRKRTMTEGSKKSLSEADDDAEMGKTALLKSDGGDDPPASSKKASKKIADDGSSSTPLVPSPPARRSTASKTSASSDLSVKSDWKQPWFIGALLAAFAALCLGVCGLIRLATGTWPWSSGESGGQDLVGVVADLPSIELVKTGEVAVSDPSVTTPPQATPLPGPPPPVLPPNPQQQDPDPAVLLEDKRLELGQKHNIYFSDSDKEVLMDTHTYTGGDWDNTIKVLKDFKQLLVKGGPEGAGPKNSFVDKIVHNPDVNAGGKGTLTYDENPKDPELDALIPVRDYLNVIARKKFPRFSPNLPELAYAEFLVEYQELQKTVQENMGDASPEEIQKTAEDVLFVANQWGIFRNPQTKAGSTAVTQYVEDLRKFAAMHEDLMKKDGYKLADIFDPAKGFKKFVAITSVMAPMFVLNKFTDEDVPLMVDNYFVGGLTGQLEYTKRGHPFHRMPIFPVTAIEKFSGMTGHSAHKILKTFHFNVEWAVGYVQARLRINLEDKRVSVPVALKMQRMGFNLAGDIDTEALKLGNAEHQKDVEDVRKALQAYFQTKYKFTDQAMSLLQEDDFTLVVSWQLQAALRLFEFAKSRPDALASAEAFEKAGGRQDPTVSASWDLMQAKMVDWQGFARGFAKDPATNDDSFEIDQKKVDTFKQQVEKFERYGVLSLRMSMVHLEAFMKHRLGLTEVKMLQDTKWVLTVQDPGEGDGNKELRSKYDAYVTALGSVPGYDYKPQRGVADEPTQEVRAMGAMTWAETEKLIEKLAIEGLTGPGSAYVYGWKASFPYKQLQSESIEKEAFKCHNANHHRPVPIPPCPTTCTCPSAVKMNVHVSDCVKEKDKKTLCSSLS